MIFNSFTQKLNFNSAVIAVKICMQEHLFHVEVKTSCNKETCFSLDGCTGKSTTVQQEEHRDSATALGEKHMHAFCGLTAKRQMISLPCEHCQALCFSHGAALI